MIIAFTTRAHSRTHTALCQQRYFRFRVVPYERLFRRRSLPRATYLFTDMDRLHFWDLEMAARIHRQLAAAGARVLNDPARFLPRHALLNAWQRAGINDFGAWRADQRPPPEAYPVFLRTESAHRGVLTDLLHGPEALEQAIARVVAEGVPWREVLVVQYRAEPVADGLFRKLAVHRVGEATVPALCVHERQWNAKFGEPGVASGELYEEEQRIVAGNPYGEPLRRAFEVAGIDYGRADFGLVRGRPQAYEINTNPAVRHPRRGTLVPARRATFAAFLERYLEALAAIDGPPAGAPIRLRDPRRLRRKLYQFWRSREWRRVPMMP